MTLQSVWLKLISIWMDSTTKISLHYCLDIFTLVWYIVFNFQRIDGTSPPQNDIKPMLRSSLKAWEKNQSKIEANRRIATNSRCFFLFFSTVLESRHTTLVMVAYKTHTHTPSHLFVYRCVCMVSSVIVRLIRTRFVFSFSSFDKNSSVCSCMLWDCVCAYALVCQHGSKHKRMMRKRRKHSKRQREREKRTISIQIDKATIDTFHLIPCHLLFTNRKTLTKFPTEQTNTQLSRLLIVDHIFGGNWKQTKRNEFVVEFWKFIEKFFRFCFTFECSYAPRSMCVIVRY